MVNERARATPSADAAAPVADRARRRVMRRLMPYLFLLYIIAYLDRVNVGYAALGMTNDLGFTPEVYGFGAAQPIANIVGAPVSGLMLGVNWLGLAGWRWLFILEGVPAVVFGVVTLFYLTDRPRHAAWLPEDEREWLTSELERERLAKHAA